MSQVHIGVPLGSVEHCPFPLHALLSNPAQVELQFAPVQPSLQEQTAAVFPGLSAQFPFPEHIALLDPPNGHSNSQVSPRQCPPHAQREVFVESTQQLCPLHVFVGSLEGAGQSTQVYPRWYCIFFTVPTVCRHLLQSVVGSVVGSGP